MKNLTWLVEVIIYLSVVGCWYFVLILGNHTKTLITSNLNLMWLFSAPLLFIVLTLSPLSSWSFKRWSVGPLCIILSVLSPQHWEHWPVSPSPCTAWDSAVLLHVPHAQEALCLQILSTPRWMRAVVLELQLNSMHSFLMAAEAAPSLCSSAGI